MVARHLQPLEELAQELSGSVAGKLTVSNDIKHSLKDADVVIAVTSAVDFLIEPEDLKAGAIVCADCGGLSGNWRLSDWS